MRYDHVRWPQGFVPVYIKIRNLAPQILNGTLIAIDPSSAGTSLPGFAIFEAGELVTSGEIAMSRKRMPVYERLPVIYERIAKLTPEPPDVFCLEMIRSQGGRELHWGVGTSIAAARTPNVVELPNQCWKALAKVSPGYFKGDAQDAEMIGKSVILLARKFTDELESAS